MLIHGRLILTSNGMMLDEVRSLLQKALRRKDRNLVTMATKELLSYGKDQLPWKSILTFLFEDQCMSDKHVLKKLYVLYQDANKYKCIELLYQCYTCRIAACLPVIALDTAYDPCGWDTELEVESSLVGLVAKKCGALNFDLLLANLKKVWLCNDQTKMLSYIKLATIAHDHEDRAVTEKGELYFINALRPKRKPNIGLVVLSLLAKITEDPSMKSYFSWAFQLAAIPDAPVRLILFCAYTQAVYGIKAKQLDKNIRLGQINWELVPVLDKMPAWAVDKHTFRGKCGKGTKHLVKKKPDNMSEELYDVFHGDRPKSGVKHFFDEGCQCTQLAIEENPFWEKTKEVYYSKPHKLQKTVRMTVVYYKDLIKKYPSIVYGSEPNNKPQPHSGEGESNVGIACTKKGKRVNCDVLENMAPKRIKLDVVEGNPDYGTKCSEASVIFQDTDGKHESRGKAQRRNPVKGKVQLRPERKMSVNPEENSGVVNNDTTERLPVGPLLQLPTGSGKVYTRLDVMSNTVWKGPYRPGRINIVAFFHKSMKDILGDPHTLSIHIHGDYVTFPLVKTEGRNICTFKKSFYDAIAKKQVENGEFVSRDSLGIVQLHNLSVRQIDIVPVTMWAHFVYRFCLNIGDSGLYNAITDTHFKFFYGIDMEERRARVAVNDVIHYLFPKLPRKAICDQILKSLQSNKSELSKVLETVDEKKISALLGMQRVLNFDLDIDLFRKRLNTFRTALDTLGESNVGSAGTKIRKRVNCDVLDNMASTRVKQDVVEGNSDNETKCSEVSITLQDTDRKYASEGKGRRRNPSKGKGQLREDKKISVNAEETSGMRKNDTNERLPVGPLLQLPTGSGKVYTRLDVTSNTVWKGPYRPGKKDIVAFFHKAMKEILGDPHTLSIHIHGDYVTFPLVKAEGEIIRTFKKSFYDAIAKKQVENGEFVRSDSRGVVQLHNLSVRQIDIVPVTMWAHFVYRFCLNVGGSGLYNAITDIDFKFFYGIDMDERRARVAGKNVIHYLFPKLPRKAICDQILKSLKRNKSELSTVLETVDEKKISALLGLQKELNFDLDIDLFKKRLDTFRTALATL